MRRPEAKSYIGTWAVLACLNADGWHVYPLPTPASELPLPKHCGACGEPFLNGCAQCDNVYLVDDWGADFHQCGAPIPWAKARTRLEERERVAQARAARGPGFLSRLWSRGIQEGVIEGLHLGLKNGLAALIGFVVGLIIGLAR